MKQNLIRLSKIGFASLVLSGCVFSALSQEFVWTQTSAPNPNAVYQSIASSSDGRKVVGVVNAGGIYTSTDYGATWVQSSAPNLENWNGVASSSDGVKLVAVVAVVSTNGRVYVSADSGTNWTKTSAPYQVWKSVASSTDGSKLVAAGDSGIYTSTDSGTTWIPRGGSLWQSVASSADGNKLVAAMSDGGVYTSTNSGVTWTQTSAPASAGTTHVLWRCVSSSADGSKLAAVIDGDQIYISTNSGTTWTPRATSRRWLAIASSSDGTKLAAAGVSGGIYTSTNSGATWIQSSVPNSTWYSIASSSEGTRLFAGFIGGVAGIYTGRITPKITQQPVGFLTCPGSSRILQVAGAGTPPLSYQWRKNGTNLIDGGNATGSVTTNLILSNVSQADTANYDVLVSNDVGSTTSSVATLTVTIVPAQATPIVVNGFIVGINLSNGGCGYANPPTIFFSGQGGTGATAYAQISNGSVTNIVITYAGSGYPSDTVTVIAPPLSPTLNIVQLLTNTPSATATPIVTNGFIVGANLTASGSGYPTSPAVSFSDSSGHGAAAYSQISNGAVTTIVITSAGSGYSSNAVINISPTPTIRVVIPSAKNLLLGQNYQLQTANDLIGWESFGTAFSATATNWTATNYSNVADTNQLFFRLEMLQ